MVLDVAEQFLYKRNKLSNLNQLIDLKPLTNANNYKTSSKNSMLLQQSRGCPEEPMGKRKSRK